MRKLIALTLLSAVSASVLATPPDAPNRLFQGRDLFALQLASDPQIRPDGREIAYVRITFDIMTDRGRQSIWLIDSESGEQRPLVTAAGSGVTLLALTVSTETGVVVFAAVLYEPARTDLCAVPSWSTPTTPVAKEATASRPAAATAGHHRGPRRRPNQIAVAASSTGQRR